MVHVLFEPIRKEYGLVVGLICLYMHREVPKKQLIYGEDQCRPISTLQVCGKGFAQNGNLKDHMKMHTGEKPHECDLCGKTFSRKILLKEHVKNHHKGMYYLCDFSASFGTETWPHSQSQNHFCPILAQRHSEEEKRGKNHFPSHEN